MAVIELSCPHFAHFHCQDPDFTDTEDESSGEAQPLADADPADLAADVPTGPSALEDGESGDGDGGLPLTIPSSEEEGGDSISASNVAVSGSPSQNLARSMSAAECALRAADAAIAATNEEEETKETMDSEFLLSQDTSMAPDVIWEENKENEELTDEEENEEEKEEPTNEQEADKEMERQIVEDKKEDLYPNPYARSALKKKKMGKKEDKRGDGQILGPSSSSNKEVDKNGDNMQNLEWLQRQVVELRRRQAATTLACKFMHGSRFSFAKLQFVRSNQRFLWNFNISWLVHHFHHPR